jgi:hypothetical protein
LAIGRGLKQLEGFRSLSSGYSDVMKDLEIDLEAYQGCVASGAASSLLLTALFLRILQSISQTLVNLNKKHWAAGMNRWANRKSLKDDLERHSRRIDNFQDTFMVRITSAYI